MATKRRSTIVTERSTIGDTTQRFTWEKSEFDDAHAAFTRWADHVRDRPDAVDRRRRNLLYASLYGNLPLLGFGINSYTRNAQQQGRIALNVIQNAIDSLVSKVCKNRPRPMFTTVEGDYELQEKAEDADRYLDGVFMNTGYYQTVYPGKVLDASIYGLGVTKCHVVDDEAVVERVFPFEMIVDGRECMYGKPRRVGQRKYWDKQEAFDAFRKGGNGKSEKRWNDELEEAVDSRAAETDRADFDRDEGSEQILVYEGYVRPTVKTPGKKIVCIRGKTLRFDDFTDKELPYNFLLPEVQTMGFWGAGICERVWTIQAEINRLVRDIQMAMHLIAKPHWMVESSSNVNTASLNNDIATIIKYTGAVPPQVYVPQSMSAEVFQHLQYLVRTLYEITGISQLSAQSQKPAGLSSAVALRTYLNVETERFNNFVRNSEESAAQDALKLARVIGAMPGKKRDVLAPAHNKGRSANVQVSWGKLDFDTVRVTVYPTSKLPDTPAGRREYALEMAQYTQVTTDDIFEMLEWDDTEAFARRRLAGKRNVERDVAKMRRGEKVIRDAIGDHKMALAMVLDAYEEAIHDGLPQSRLGIFRNYIKATYRFLTGKAWLDNGPNPIPGDPPMTALQPPAPMGMPQPMLPPGAPMPPPAPMMNGGMPAPPLPPPGP